jgi:hypothetical protein
MAWRQGIGGRDFDMTSGSCFEPVFLLISWSKKGRMTEGLARGLCSFSTIHVHLDSIHFDQYPEVEATEATETFRTGM